MTCWLVVIWITCFSTWLVVGEQKVQDVTVPVSPVAAAAHLETLEFPATAPAPDRVKVHSEEIGNFTTCHEPEVFPVPLRSSVFQDATPMLRVTFRIEPGSPRVFSSHAPIDWSPAVLRRTHGAFD